MSIQITKSTAASGHRPSLSLSQKTDANVVTKTPIIDNENDNAKSSDLTTNPSVESSGPKEKDKQIVKKDTLELKQKKDVLSQAKINDSNSGDIIERENQTKANGQKSDKKDKKNNGVEKQEESDKETNIKTEIVSVSKKNPDNKSDENTKPMENKPDGTINMKSGDDKLNEIAKIADDAPGIIKRKAGSSAASIDQSMETHTAEISNNTVDDDEMECLIIDPEVEVPQPTASGKILKLMTSSSMLPSYESPKKDPSALKNSLEKQISIKDISTSPTSNNQETISDSRASTPAVERPSSFRAISGRRSLRPLPERSFQNFYRESYKKISADTSTSSLNVTVGSEVPNDSTLSFFGRGKKRERQCTADNLIEVGLSPKTPKRARLDVSGFLNIVKTPISILRSHFSKTRIQSSTPNINTIQKSEEDGVENVSIIETEEAIDNEVTMDTNEIEGNIAEIEKEKALKEATVESLTNELKVDAQIERKTCTLM